MKMILCLCMAILLVAGIAGIASAETQVILKVHQAPTYDGYNFFAPYVPVECGGLQYVGHTLAVTDKKVAGYLQHQVGANVILYDNQAEALRALFSGESNALVGKAPRVSMF